MTTDDHPAAFRAAFDALPLIAILRGLKPDEAIDVGAALVEAGIRIIEVPLNSPEPFMSIERLAKRFGSEAVVGAGTVTKVDEVRRLADCGGRIAVSPHADTGVIAETARLGLASAPGILSPTEAFAALNAGAHALKLFPLEIIGPRGVTAMRAVLPRGLRLIGVGGVSPESIADLKKAGCDGFGIGGALYKPGATAADVRAKAERFVASMRAA
jgi:2-dehydro-3-deoxyphosphogalactonate aldolase